MATQSRRAFIRQGTAAALGLCASVLADTLIETGRALKRPRIPTGEARSESRATPAARRFESAVSTSVSVHPDQFGVRRQRECDALSALPATPLWITAERRCLQKRDGLGGCRNLRSAGSQSGVAGSPDKASHSLCRRTPNWFAPIPAILCNSALRTLRQERQRQPISRLEDL